MLPHVKFINKNVFLLMIYKENVCLKGTLNSIQFTTALSEPLYEQLRKKHFENPYYLFLKNKTAC